MKLKFVLPLLLTAIAMPSYAYRAEVGVISGSGNYDSDSLSGDSDYDIFIFNADVYFEDVAGDGALAELPFLTKTSSVGVSSSKQDYDEFDYLFEQRSLDGRFVIPQNNLIAEFSVARSEVDDFDYEESTVTFGLGTYITDNSAIVGRIGRINEDSFGSEVDLGILGVNYEHYAPVGGSNQAVKFEVDLELVGGEDDANNDISAATFTIDAAFYINKSFAIGASSEGFAVDNDFDECSSSTLTVYADYFVVENFRLSAAMIGSAEECDNDPAEPENGAFLIGIAGRF